jgi:hypothetical protein
MRAAVLMAAACWFATNESVLAVPPPAGIAPFVSPAGGLSIDGDVAANAPGAGVGDWIFCPAFPGAGAGVLDKSGAPLNPSTTFHFIDPYANSGPDIVFAGGHKWFDNPNDWEWTSGKCSSKTDINNVLLHIETDAQGHIWAAISADRLSTSGDAYIDFEFLQNTLTRTNAGGFASTGPHGGRTTNDLLLSLAFTGGGKVADFYAWRWQADGSGFAYKDITPSLPAGRVFVALNSNSVVVPYGAFDKTNYAPNAFAEAAVDLTALVANLDPCLHIGVRTIMVKTKASQSSTATIEDFIDPIQYLLRIGPDANAGQDQARCAEGATTAFALAGTAAAGIYPITSTRWTVLEGSAVLDAPDSLQCVAQVASATATLRLTVTEANGCIVTDEVRLTVWQRPSSTITGVTRMCPGGVMQFTAPPGLAAYSWSISGNGTLSGPTNGSSVSVIAGTTCGTSFTLSLQVQDNYCSSRSTLEVRTEDLSNPILLLPADVTLECPANPATNVTGTASATDDCGPVTLSYSDSFTPGCGGSGVLRRNWVAVDRCGNATNAIQTITLLDRLPPALLAPNDLTVECSAPTDPDHTGRAIASDGCGAATVSYTDSFAPGCGNSGVLTRSWKAIDLCGNSATAIQRITVADRTAPQVTPPADRTIECTASTAPSSTGTATATDTCGSAVVTYTDSFAPGCGNSGVLTRTWRATDPCGNSGTAVQRLTILDRTPPRLTTPADRTVDCSAATAPSDTGVATATDTCGNATVSYTDSFAPGCGNNGVISRTWKAMDDCGNSTTGVQRITIVDRTAPLIACPPARTIECSDSTAPAATGTATASDNCSTATVTYTDSFARNCGNAGILSRTWRAVDACGNVATAVQRITIVDRTAPLITCPPDRTIECSESTGPANTGSATATDACSNPRLSYTDSFVPSCGRAGIITRTWKATDDCGNSATCTQRISVVDTTPPAIECTLVCTYSQGGYGGGGTPAALLADNYTRIFPNGLSVGQYNPGNGAAAPNGLFWQPNNAGLAALRAFLGGAGSSGPLRADALNPTDDLDGGELASQAATVTINIALNTAGVIGAGPNNFGSLIYTQDGDSLSGLTISEILAAANRALAGLGLPAGHSYSSLNDLLDRFNHSFHECSVNAWTPGHLSAPALVVPCASQIPAPNPAFVRASDACGSVSVTALPDAVQEQLCPNRMTLLRVWVATDQCGNQSTCSYFIFVTDTNAPVLKCAAERTVAFDTNWSFDEPSATDQCGTAIVTVAYTVTNWTGAQSFTAVRSWQAIDDCANASYCLQTINVVDPRVVQDNFDSGDDGWRAASTSLQVAPKCLTYGGQSGGYICADDAAAGNNWYWMAPAAFLGNRSANYDGTLRFALRQSSVGNPILTDSVMLCGAGLTLVLALPQAPGTTWTPFVLHLNETSGWTNALTRRAATQAELVSVLATLTNLCIRGDYQVGSITTGLDNVELLPPLNAPTAWVLDAQRTVGSKLKLRWPVMATGFQLEVSSSLNAPDWLPASLNPTMTNGLYEVQLPPSAAPLFYRLRKQ